MILSAAPYADLRNMSKGQRLMNTEGLAESRLAVERWLDPLRDPSSKAPHPPVPPPVARSADGVEHQGKSAEADHEYICHARKCGKQGHGHGLG